MTRTALSRASTLRPGGRSIPSPSAGQLTAPHPLCSDAPPKPPPSSPRLPAPPSERRPGARARRRPNQPGPRPERPPLPSPEFERTHLPSFCGVKKASSEPTLGRPGKDSRAELKSSLAEAERGIGEERPFSATPASGAAAARTRSASERKSRISPVARLSSRAATRSCVSGEALPSTTESQSEQYARRDCANRATAGQLRQRRLSRTSHRTHRTANAHRPLGESLPPSGGARKRSYRSRVSLAAKCCASWSAPGVRVRVGVRVGVGQTAARAGARRGTGGS